MNVQVRQRTAAQRLMVVDCDIHPAFRKPTDLDPFLPARWREHQETFSGHARQGLAGQLAYPRMMASGMRVDSFPEDGGFPGSNLDLLRRQHLDANGVECGILIALGRSGMEERNLDYAAALSRAVNDWQLECWVKPEPRLRAGIIVPQEHAEFAVQEIERCATDRRYVQVLFSPRSSDPPGHRRYWPIYAAAERCGLPVAMHVAGFSGGHPSTGSGWPTYYMQEHYAMTTNMQGNVVSMIFEGVFERFPKLKVVLIEGGFGWVPALSWRMDKTWTRMRGEIPHLQRPPSEYLREHFWLTTQPIEEPDRPEDLCDIFNWIGWDRLLYSSDYPHWDFDHPELSFKPKMTPQQRAQVFRDNAKALYDLQ